MVGGLGEWAWVREEWGGFRQGCDFWVTGGGSRGGGGAGGGCWRAIFCGDFLFDDEETHEEVESEEGHAEPKDAAVSCFGVEDPAEDGCEERCY